MKGFVALILAINMAMAGPSYAEMRTSCGASTMLTSFVPCMTFFFNLRPNETIPPSECCRALKNLASGGMDCFCLFMTGTVPFTVPINRTLTNYLPQACDIPSVLQCRTSNSSLPPPAYLGVHPSAPTPSPSPKVSSVVPSPMTPPEAPLSDTRPPLSPPSSPSVHSNAPTLVASRVRSQLTPSSATPSYSFSPSLLLMVLGLVVLKYY